MFENIFTLAIIYFLQYLTSSGSVILNSQPSPVQEMKCWQVLSERSSRMNCQSWMGPVGVMVGPGCGADTPTGGGEGRLVSCGAGAG